MDQSTRCSSQVDPVDAWKPWQPTSEEPWGRKWAAHLYRRAAFGYSRDDLVEAERLGPQGTLDLLLEGRPQATEALETLIDAGRLAAEHDDGGDQLRGWWLYCMLQGGHPLCEKMTLFWHNHFATSLVKVQSPSLMFRQNCLLREHAWADLDRCCKRSAATVRCWSGLIPTAMSRASRTKTMLAS